MPALSQDKQLLKRRKALGPAYRLFYEQPLHPVRGEDVWLFDADGRRYLDAYNNVPVVGHANPVVAQALAQQAATLNTHTRYLHENVVRYAERLTALFPRDLDTAMFTCTGSEANDLALRIAQEVTGRRGVIVTRNAYHGVTMALADISPSLRPHGAHVIAVGPPVLNGVAPDAVAASFARRIDLAARELAYRGTPLAALILDTVFASDGVHIDAAPVLSAAAAAARRNGGLFIADEVQGGFARTGRWWAFERESGEYGKGGVVPDMVSLGKPMGNGHPIGALILKAELAKIFGKRCRYFNTFGGNTVSAAVGMAVLDELQRMDMPARVARVGAYLSQSLHKLASVCPLINQARGDGLYWGVEMKDGATASMVVNEMRRNGVLINVSGAKNDTLKIRPPLTFTEEHADLLLIMLAQVCDRLT